MHKVWRSETGAKTFRGDETCSTEAAQPCQELRACLRQLIVGKREKLRGGGGGGRDEYSPNVCSDEVAPISLQGHKACCLKVPIQQISLGL